MKKIIAIVVVLLLAGCSTKQKTVHREQTKFQFDATIDTAAKFSAHLKAETSDVAKEENSFSNVNVEFEGQCPDDSLTVTEYGPDGKMKSRTTFQGKGKGSYSKGHQQTKKENESKGQIILDTKLEASGNRNISGSRSAAILDKNKEVSGFDFWFWLWLIIIGIVLVLLWYLNRQFGWLGRIKKYVRKQNPEEDTFA
jgi:hypothetical protein